MELRNIKTFLYVAEQESFSRAAGILGYAQSTVTAQIQQLEQELEVALFERIHKTVRLTSAGQEFLSYAQTILHTAEVAQRRMRHLPMESGVLRFAMAESLCTTYFPRILAMYHQSCPKVEIQLLTGDTVDLFHLLRHNEADLVYTLDHRIYSPDIVTVMEKREEIIFVAAPTHPAAQRPLTFSDLVQQEFLLTEKNMSYRQHFEERLAMQSLEVRPFLEFGNVDMLRSLVEAGIGVSFLPEFAVRNSLAAGSLVRLQVQEAPFFVWRQLVHHKSKWLTPPMKAMIALMQELGMEADG